jgi:type II secretory pathway pseudopilin PulG
MRNESGITFFELMTVLAVLAIMASIAVPGFINWLPRYRMRAAADELLSTMWMAQKRAVTENANVAVAFDFAGEAYLAFIDNGASPDDGIRQADETLIKNGQMPAGIDLQRGGSDPLATVFHFNRRGFPQDLSAAPPAPCGGNVTVTNGAIERTINLTLAGSASM